MKPGEGLDAVRRPPQVEAGQGARRGRSIGEILVDAGRLGAEDAARIAAKQRESGLHFGEAAMRLGLLQPADIELALARQFEYPYLTAGEAALAPELVAAYQPFGAVAEQLRSLRTRLLMHYMTVANVPRSVAVVSPGAGEGRSFIAANLAVVFSQMGERTLLVDADLRHPRQHRLFRLRNRQGLANMLLGRANFDCVAPVPMFRHLSVLTAGSAAPNPLELLCWPTLPALLREAAAAYDVVVVDTPPAAASADAQVIAGRTGSAVLLARAGRSDGPALRRVRRSMRDAGVQLIGSVLNGA